MLVLHPLSLLKILQPQAKFTHLLDSLGILNLQGPVPRFLGSLRQLHPLLVLALHSLIPRWLLHFEVQFLHLLGSLSLNPLQAQFPHPIHLQRLDSLMVQFVQLPGLLADFQSIPLFPRLVANLQLLPLLYHHLAMVYWYLMVLLGANH